jgi:hypothetical protein
MNNLLKSASPIHWLLTGSLFVLVIFTDIYVRLAITEKGYIKPNKTFENKYNQNNTVTKTELDGVLSTYADYDVEKKLVKPSKKKVVKKGISLEEQNKQQGKLEKFFIGDKKYILSGVFYEQQYFAVLIETDLNTKKVKELKVFPGQVLSPYKVGEITKHSIEFLFKEKIIKLVIF